MQCIETTSETLKYLLDFANKSRQLRVPLSGSLDITHRCNLRCVHCYVGPQDNAKNIKKNELDTKRVMLLIDEIVKAGCLFLLISGGEPLLRTDFQKIYRHAKMQGIIVTIFTNGLLLTDSIAEMFQEIPPKEIEISLYGAKPETHEKITGVSGSYRRCLDSIETLLRYGVNVNLKTVLMTLNQYELFDIEKIAIDFGIKFRFDAAIFPRFNGDDFPLKLRVSPEDVVSKELSSSETLQKYAEYYRKYQQSSVYDTLYVCSAGVTNFHVDPYGNLQPCLMTRDVQHNLNENSFLKGWSDVMPKIIEKKVNNEYNCNRCETRALCGYCPAFFMLENGSEYLKSEYLCTMGKIRHQMIKDVYTCRV